MIFVILYGNLSVFQNKTLFLHTATYTEDTPLTNPILSQQQRETINNIICHSPKSFNAVKTRLQYVHLNSYLHLCNTTITYWLPMTLRLVTNESTPQLLLVRKRTANDAKRLSEYDCFALILEQS